MGTKQNYHRQLSGRRSLEIRKKRPTKTRNLKNMAWYEAAARSVGIRKSPQTLYYGEDDGQSEWIRVR
jgi:hypothetical protein